MKGYELMLSDLEIAQHATLKHIHEIAEQMELEPEDLDLFGSPYVAKLRMDVLEKVKDRPNAKYIDVTAITPTPLGEGKSTTSVGLGQAMKHIGKRSVGSEVPGEQTLQLFPATSGESFYIDAEGSYWRCYNFIKNAYSVDVVENEDQAYAAAKSFGEFLELVSDLDVSQLVEVIEDFHHTPKRLEALEVAVDLDIAGRLDGVKHELEFILSRRELCSSLQALRENGVVPDRVTHNDTKMNNVMLSCSTHQGVCVIDLDTVMPGLSLYDFGDLVRTSVSPAAEDEVDLSKVEVRMPIFQSLCRGFLQGCPSLTKLEKENLVVGSKVITIEVAIRFLTDYLNGDVYFKTHHAQHNLDRCRNQIQLVKELERHEEELTNYVNQLS